MCVSCEVREAQRKAKAESRKQSVSQKLRLRLSQNETLISVSDTEPRFVVEVREMARLEGPGTRRLGHLRSAVVGCAQRGNGREARQLEAGTAGTYTVARKDPDVNAGVRALSLSCVKWSACV